MREKISEYFGHFRKEDLSSWKQFFHSIFFGWILFLTFVVYPVIQAVFTSFYEWNGLGPLDDSIGLKNYDRMFKISAFFEALAETGTVCSTCWHY